MLFRCAACAAVHSVCSYKKRCFAAAPLALSPTGWAPTKSDALTLRRLLGRPQGGLLQKAMLCRCAACSVAHRVGPYRGALTFVCRRPPCGRPLTTSPDRKSTRLNSSHSYATRIPSSAHKTKNTHYLQAT